MIWESNNAMQLKSIKISNYRSIEELSFDIAKLDDKTCTYGLIGVNEAGKSTILKAMALKDGLKDEKNQPLPLQKDFKDKALPIEIEYLYDLDKKEIEQCKDVLNSQTEPIETGGLNFSEVKLVIFFEYQSPSNLGNKIELVKVSDEYDKKAAIQEILKQFILDKSHKSIFWTSEDRYLISQPINLAQFAEAPSDISIPLKNCFALAGIVGQDVIKNRISQITESTEREQLKTELGEKVTEHINAAWPKHPIKITFDISDGLINFHVHDLETRGKAKTADQRSDGFKQFVSFLLTVSAQNKNEELSNAILLLDEPETHLHPQAQEDLLKELIKITQNERNNITFFATHSNYMIDKNDLSRNYKIFKKPDEKKEKERTDKKQFDKKASSYASVTYEVFEIASADYHNELYDKLREDYSSKLKKDSIGISEFDDGFFKQEKVLAKSFPEKGQKNKVTLPTYVRNCIHYPVNKNDKFKEHLTNSISLLREYLEII